MDDRVLRLRVGVVVLAAALITAFLVARFGDLPLPGSGTYTVYVQFPRAPGVTQGSPVRMSGVQIGRVTEIQLLKGRGVRVIAVIDSQREILDCDAVWITSASVLGDSVLEFVRPDEIPATAQPLDDRTEIVNGRVAANPLETLTNLEPNLQEALVSFKSASAEVASTARNFNTVVGNNQDQLPRVTQKAERALDQFAVAMNNLNEIFDDPQMREDLRSSLQVLPQTIRNADQTLQKANAAFDSMKQASDRASINLSNLENFTKPLGERGPQLVDNIDGSLANINELLEQLVTFTDRLNSREGTLGRILYDDRLYLKLEHTLDNVSDITSQIKPIVSDFRIFSDKLARDPRIIGLKGALDKRPLGTGSKGAPLSSGGHEAPIIVDGNGWDPVILD
jgi:phospholipid/cholesterol/gamma-HCH transport system substrate-binding protein